MSNGDVVYWLTAVMIGLYCWDFYARKRRRLEKEREESRLSQERGATIKRQDGRVASR